MKVLCPPIVIEQAKKSLANADCLGPVGLTEVRFLKWNGVNLALVEESHRYKHM